MFSKLFGKRKKYPQNQKSRPVAVYAGPEYFRKKAQEDEPIDVYAGPEFFEGPLPPDEDERFFTIYAGPKPPEDPPAPVYAGPKPGGRPEKL